MTASRLPAALIDLVRAWVRDRELRPVATLSTARTVHLLVDAAGQVLAEGRDDVVTAQAPRPDGSATLSHWREWEIELVDGPAELLDAAGNADAQGRRRAVRLVVQSSPAPSVPRSPSPPAFDRLTGRSRAGEVLHAHLVEQVDALLDLGRPGPA